MMKDSNFQTCPRMTVPSKGGLEKLLNIQRVILFKHPYRQSQSKLWEDTKGISINPPFRNVENIDPCH